jgi:archaellum component FlaC
LSEEPFIFWFLRSVSQDTEKQSGAAKNAIAEKIIMELLSDIDTSLDSLNTTIEKLSVQAIDSAREIEQLKKRVDRLEKK